LSRFHLLDANLHESKSFLELHPDGKAFTVSYRSGPLEMSLENWSIPNKKRIWKKKGESFKNVRYSKDGKHLFLLTGGFTIINSSANLSEYYLLGKYYFTSSDMCSLEKNKCYQNPVSTCFESDDNICWKVVSLPNASSENFVHFYSYVVARKPFILYSYTQFSLFKWECQ
jgi:hypothetical protein